MDVQTNQTFATRKLKKEYTITNNIAYEYYKLDITLNSGHAYTQLAEWELID
ncbi:hypothetical protein D3C86_2177840 [compost metagenome]